MKVALAVVRLLAVGALAVVGVGLVTVAAFALPLLLADFLG